MRMASMCEFTIFLIIAGCCCLMEVVEGANEFRRCYNTSVEMHCFAVQYDTNNALLITSNDNARQRCNDLKSTLIIIKDEETNNIVNNYISDPLNPIRNQYVWTDAYRVSDYNNSYTWHWVDSTLPNIAAFDVLNTWDPTWHIASLGFGSQNNKSMFYLSANQPHFLNSYVCEYTVSRCPSTGSNVRQFAGRCYIAVNASMSWYEARNRCLKDGGDLASFANVASINFTSWLDSAPNNRYWIGLRFSWYIWQDSGEEVKFSKWLVNFNDYISQCLIACSNCNPSFSWLPKDCNTMNNIYVVCHTVISLQTTTASTVETTTSAATAKPMSTTQSANIQVMPTSSRTSDGKLSPESTLGIGLGVGLGVPLVIFIILTVLLAVKRRRSERLPEQKAHSDNNELDIVREPSVGQVNDSANDHYQHLDRNLDNSSGAMYDKLRVEPEQNYEEFPTSAT